LALGKMFIIAWGVEIQITDPDHRALRQRYPNIGFHLSNSLNKSNGTILLTDARKYYQAHSVRQVISGDMIPNSEEKFRIRKLINRDAQFYLYIFPIQLPPLRVITFNLGYNIQKNKIQGSEAPQVAICQIAYPQNQGWSAPNNSPGGTILSTCTSNAVNWLAQQFPDLIGLQEVAEKYLPEMVSTLNKKTSQNYLAILAGTAAIVYNPAILGDGYLITSPDLVILEQNRSLMVVWFPFSEILVINLHAPHRIDLRSNLTKILETIKLNVSPRRILMTGDFNDTSENPLTSISLFGFELKQPGPSPISCCTDRNYQYPGDYIFDSKIGMKYYGTPKDAPKQLMSDHYPVMYDST